MPDKRLILQLYDAGAVRFGRFRLKSGIISPIYIDLRILVSYPSIMRAVARAYGLILKKLHYDRLAAVPYAALPIACAISLHLNKPWIYTRREAKNYGLKKPVEGVFEKGETIVVIDDLITTGLSKKEIITPLEKLGLVVKDVVVLIDRVQGGREALAKDGYQLHAVFSINDILDTLVKTKKISKSLSQKVANFLRGQTD